MFFTLLALAATAAAFDTAAHRRDVEAWQQARDTRLRADGGWLTLAGLFWLKPGPNRFGTDPAADVVLPAGATPARAGTIVLDKAGVVTIDLAADVVASVAGKPVARTATLRSDAGPGGPDVLTLGAVTLQIIDRHGRLAVRVKDAHATTRRDFKGVRFYPVDPRLRVVARFVRHVRPVTLSVPTVLGVAESLPSPGYAEFELGGKTFRLHPVIESPGDKQLFFVFRDLTAGKSTYGAGRFLYADPPPTDAGADAAYIVLDFNKAYSPPCAFTPYATCPLPPAGNRLPIAVEAGELFHAHP